MPKFSISQYAEMCGRDRTTISIKLRDMTFEPGPRRSRLYESVHALELIFGFTIGGDVPTITQAEATRLLTVARGQQVELEMEVTRKERVPIEDITEINEEALSNAAGLLKANTGKQLTEEIVNDVFSCFRGIAAKLKGLVE